MHFIVRPIRLAVFLLSVSLLACYSKDFREPGKRELPKYETRRAYKANFNTTWDAVISALRDAPVVSARKDAGVIVTDWIISKSDRLYSGYDSTEIPSKIRYKFYIRLKPIKRGTIVDIDNEEQYYTDSITKGGEFKGSLYNWVDTPSSTLKEKRLLDIIETTLEKKTKVK